MMGQAKNRGTYEERRAAALARHEADELAWQVAQARTRPTGIASASPGQRHRKNYNARTIAIAAAMMATMTGEGEGK